MWSHIIRRIESVCNVNEVQTPRKKAYYIKDYLIKYVLEIFLTCPSLLIHVECHCIAAVVGSSGHSPLWHHYSEWREHICYRLLWGQSYNNPQGFFRSTRSNYKGTWSQEINLKQFSNEWSNAPRENTLIHTSRHVFSFIPFSRWHDRMNFVDSR